MVSESHGHQIAEDARHIQNFVISLSRGLMRRRKEQRRVGPGLRGVMQQVERAQGTAESEKLVYEPRCGMVDVRS